MKRKTTLFVIGMFIVLNVHTQTFLTNGLIAYYPFNGNANDESGNGFNGTLGKVISCPDHRGTMNGAFGFVGNGWINLPNNILENHNSQGTVSLWFVANNLHPQDTEYLLAAHAMANGQPNRFYLGINNGRLFVSIGNPSRDAYSSPIASQKWYHACIVWSDGGNVAVLYLNGMKSVGLNGIGLKSPIEAVNLGAWKQASGFLHGVIDDFRIYSRAFSPDEVAQLFNAEINASNSPALVVNHDSLAPTEISIPPAILSVARQLSPPTNEIAELSFVTGSVRVLDTKGLLIETNFVYLPRIPLADLQNSDYLELLENKQAYSTLTSFGNSKSRTAQSEPFENQMRQIWLHGKTLQNKIQTRLAGLDEMRNYNAAVITYSTASLHARQFQAGAENMANSSANYQAAASTAEKNYNQVKAQNEYDKRYAVRPGTTMEDEVIAAVGAMKANDSSEQAANSANNLANQAVAANQKGLAAAQKAINSAKRLAEYGITVPSEPPFYQIPPLSMRLEVDAERAAQQ